MMPSDQTIICLAPDPWEGLWRNRHQIMTRLARRHDVVYVEPRMYLPDLRQRMRDGRIGWAEMCAPLLRHDRDRLWIYHDPYFAPYAGPATRRCDHIRTSQGDDAPCDPLAEGEKRGASTDSLAFASVSNRISWVGSESSSWSTTSSTSTVLTR